MHYRARRLYSALRYNTKFGERLALLLVGYYLRLRGRFRKSKRPEEPNTDTVCALPWVHSFTSEVGYNFPCCISTGTFLPNVNSLGQPYRVYEPGQLEQSWNSKYMKALRRSMLAGKRPLPCDRCYKMEDLGISSHRQWANLNWKKQLDQALQRTSPDGKAPLRLYSADIRIGNQCNLKCRMCGPVSSKGLAAEWNQMNMIGAKEAEYYQKMDWFERPEFWEMFLKYSDDLESLHFAGGEPFMIKQHFLFLQKLVEKGISQKLSLSYNSNLTVLPQELLELWKNFKFVDVMVSLDGTEQVNHFIRYPSNWKTIQKNIKFLHDHLKEYGIRRLDFNITVQMYNIFNLMELIDFLIEEYPSAISPTLSPLFNPEEFSIQVLPRHLKEKLDVAFTKYLQDRKPAWETKLDNSHHEPERLVQNIEGLLKFMNEQDRSDLLGKFKSRTRFFDLSRKQDCRNVIPELSGVLTHEGV